MSRQHDFQREFQHDFALLHSTFRRILFSKLTASLTSKVGWIALPESEVRLASCRIDCRWLRPPILSDWPKTPKFRL